MQLCIFDGVTVCIVGHVFKSYFVLGVNKIFVVNIMTKEFLQVFNIQYL